MVDSNSSMEEVNKEETSSSTIRDSMMTSRAEAKDMVEARATVEVKDKDMVEVKDNKADTAEAKDKVDMVVMIRVMEVDSKVVNMGVVSRAANTVVDNNKASSIIMVSTLKVIELLAEI